MGAHRVGPVRTAAAGAEWLAVGRAGRGRPRVQRRAVAARRRQAALPAGRSRTRFPAGHPPLPAVRPAADAGIPVAPRHRRRRMGDPGVRRWLRDADRTITYGRNRRDRKDRRGKHFLCEFRGLGGSIWTYSLEPRQVDRRDTRLRGLRQRRRGRVRLVGAAGDQPVAAAGVHARRAGGGGRSRGAGRDDSGPARRQHLGAGDGCSACCGLRA